jgi:multisubunit Na+/H+ antiporter MnhG subunit
MSAEHLAHLVGVVCFGVGVAVVVLAALGSLRVRRPEDRLHFLTPTTSLGTPLVGLGLVLENGWSLTSAQIVLTCVLLMITGPVLASATLRLAAQWEGSVSRESPE